MFSWLNICLGDMCHKVFVEVKTTISSIEVLKKKFDEYDNHGSLKIWLSFIEALLNKLRKLCQI